MRQISSQPGRLARTHGEDPGLPRGRTRLSDDRRRAAHRERLVRAVIATAAELGYTKMTVADVVRRARVSRNVFYEHFADKEQAFLVALSEGARLLFEHIAAGTLGSNAVDRLRASLRAYLEFLAAEPEFARCFLIEVFAAGPAARDQLYVARARFAAGIARWHRRARRAQPDWPPVPADVYSALVGAMHELVVTRVRDGRTARLPELENTAVRLYLAALRGWPAD
jgi:AcrR family transcriptional regulator